MMKNKGSKALVCFRNAKEVRVSSAEAAREKMVEERTCSLQKTSSLKHLFIFCLSLKSRMAANGHIFA